ncbi:MAG: hypothetical protein CL916_04980 [Deltaproteobacteria bacterium]|nr:hypothetical protein [Deltaproteobacteria bacterium]
MNIQASDIRVCLYSFAKMQKVQQRKRISLIKIFKRLHRKQIEKSRIPSQQCEFLWSSQRCKGGTSPQIEQSRKKRYILFRNSYVIYSELRLFGLQKEKMWDSLCSMYQSHKIEKEEHILSKIELRFIESFLQTQVNSSVLPLFECLGKELDGSNIFLLWCDIDNSGVVLHSTKKNEIFLRWPLLGPFSRALEGYPSIIFDARMIPILKVLPIVSSGNACSIIQRAWKKDEKYFLLIATHQNVGQFSHVSQKILDLCVQKIVVYACDVLHDCMQKYITSINMNRVDTQAINTVPIQSTSQQSLTSSQTEIVFEPPTTSETMERTNTTSETLQTQSHTLIKHNRYQILEELGKGGFGTVYRAFDSVLKRDVALKTLIHQKEIHEFSREAALAASLQHPNIVTIYDLVFQTDDHEPFIVMEFLDGIDLHKSLVTSGKCSVEQVITFMIPVLEALGLGHRYGLIHRDLKPSNLFLLRNTSTPIVKIVDFGIAVLIKDGCAITKSITGTMRYMPPEYIEDQIVTPQHDVYQVGLIMLELLSGYPAIDDQKGETWSNIIFGKIRFPSNFDSNPLYHVIRRATSVNYKQRYATGTEMMHALINVAQERSILSPLG